MMTHAHCFYTDGRTVGGQPVWQVTDFEMTLTRQQPTHWAVSEGRAGQSAWTTQTVSIRV